MSMLSTFTGILDVSIGIMSWLNQDEVHNLFKNNVISYPVRNILLCTVVNMYMYMTYNNFLPLLQ